METMVDKIKAYILQDVSNENETKNLAVVLRCISLLGCFFYGAYVVVFLYFGVLVYLIDLFLVFVCILTYYLTYKSQSILSMWIIIVGKALFIVSHIITLGWNLGFQYFFIELFILLYYGYYNRIAFKLYFTATICLGSIILYFKYKSDYLFLGYHKYINEFCEIFNLISIIVVLSVIVFYFSAKSNEAEIKLIQYNKKLEYLASMDPLTNLYNRRKMMSYLEKKCSEYSKESQDFSLSIGDIDFFKQVNDKYGHEAGDFILVELSQLIKDFIEGKGRVARWGGEEFLFVLEKVNMDEAAILLNDLLFLIRKHIFRYNNTDIKITMTFGVAEYDSSRNIDGTIQDADTNLYRGKNAGRSIVIF